MTDQEANQIIAEYMGLRVDRYFGSLSMLIVNSSGQSAEVSSYTKSLDALVPVWEKMAKDIRFWGGIMVYSCIVKGVKQSFDVESNNQDELHLETYSEDKETIQQAAAHATAKAILELKYTKEF